MDIARFDTLYVKLFAAIAGGIAVLTLIAYFVFSWSFERGFVQYLNGADEARLDVMVERLATDYQRVGDWSWIAHDRDQWAELSREVLGLARSSDDAQNGQRITLRRDTPLTIDPRLMLFDSARHLLIGRPEAAQSAVLKNILVEGNTVGYLGYIPRPEFILTVERVYLERQRVAFSALALGMLGAALVLGAGLAYWLTRRIRLLAQGTHALISGDYGIQLTVRSHDELAQLARDFNTLAATLAATRKARQQWIADIAHELRTPLAVLRGEIEALQDGVRPLDQSAIASLAGESARLARIVEDLHTLSMSDLGALTYHKEPIEIDEVIIETIDTQRRALELRGLVIETSFAGHARLWADETRLQQIFGNLLQNNLRYTRAPGTVAVTAKLEGDQVVIVWEDSGPGVSPEELPRLGERLYRVESSRSRSEGGSGLGLAIVKAIVEGHAGTLTARAGGRGGLAIEIRLPAYNGNHHG